MDANPAIERSRPEIAAEPPSDRAYGPGLSREEEHLLAAMVAKGDRSARNRMVQANLPLVKKIARDFVGRGLELEDLVGEGNLGLMRAAEGFDPSFGARFATYASYWIKQSIRHALINTTAPIRLPAHMVALLTKWRRAERAFTRVHGRNPTFQEVASQLRISEGQSSLIANALRTRHIERGLSLDSKLQEWSLSDSIHRCASPQSVVEAHDAQEELMRRIERLDDRERAILRLRYWAEGGGLTHKEIGRRLGLTREWVRVLEVRALRKLARYD
ncbi:MAG: RNA polymerase sigma factor RpoD/SigA [Isosphaeraceae bacterium]